MPNFPIRVAILIGFCLATYGFYYIAEVTTLYGIAFLSLGSALFAVGASAQYILDWHRTKNFWDVFIGALIGLGVLCAILIAIKVETLICVVVLFPPAALLIALGIIFTRTLLRRFEPNKTNATLMLALPLALVLLSPADPNKTEVMSVTTDIIVAADMQALRALVENVAPISDHERPWTITHNLLGAPRPSHAVTKDGVRHAYWTKGIYFHEEIIEQSPTDLVWSFSFPEPDLLRKIDPRISPIGPDVEMLTGQYHFTPLADGRTKVSLTTRYELNTPVNWYLRPWGRLFLGDFHHAVLNVIASRADQLVNEGQL